MNSEPAGSEAGFYLPWGARAIFMGGAVLCVTPLGSPGLALAIGLVLGLGRLLQRRHGKESSTGN